MHKRNFELTNDEITDLINHNEPRQAIAEYLGISKRRLDQVMHPQRSRCHILVRLAIKKGLIEKFPCEKCGSVKSQAHHPDYNKPLEVIWLCSKHHHELHKLSRVDRNITPTGGGNPKNDDSVIIFGRIYIFKNDQDAIFASGDTG